MFRRLYETPTTNSPREARATLAPWSLICFTGSAPRLHVTSMRVSDCTLLETVACNHLEDGCDLARRHVEEDVPE